MKTIETMVKKRIHYSDCGIYALYYRSRNTIYYNMDFSGKSKIIILK
jgi:hypothetical protein